jgi:hypothetical protein
LFGTFGFNRRYVPQASFSEGALRNRIFIFIMAHAALLGGALTLLH